MADHYPQKKSSEPENIDLLGELSMKRQFSKPEVVYASDDHTDVLKGNDHISYFGDVRTGKQSSSSFCSHSRNFGNNHTNVLESPVGGSFVGDGKIHQSTEGMNSYGNAAVIFDDSGSDDDNCEFYVEEDYKGQEFSLKFSSPGGNSSSIPLDNLNAWSSERRSDEV
ncbi:hypothetical protein GBA52_000043 [Prunus armeniaca]|nr:hypothetical protein GBA52_000043 [Prunus armeniaca]